MKRTIAALSIVVAGAVHSAPALARHTPAPRQDDVRIERIKVSGNVHMLVGQGGNLGVIVGPDGAFLIDDQFAPLSQKILAAIGQLTPEPVRFVVNTHWHGDHTGGNENLAGAGAIIVAHENVRARMSRENFMKAFDRRVPPAPEKALPVVTFTDAVTFHWNGETVEIFHVDPAHTDGDSVVHFRKANVIHAGDLYFNGLYPFIDTGAHGNIDGMIKGVDRILERVDKDTKIIPGHGPLSGVSELHTYRRMLIGVRDAVRTLVREGKSREEAVSAKPTAAFDEAWGKGFLDPDAFTGIVYDGMKGTGG